MQEMVGIVSGQTASLRIAGSAVSLTGSEMH